MRLFLKLEAPASKSLFPANLQFGWIQVSISSMKDRIEGYKDQRVVVNALGVKYSGIYKGGDEDWVYLQCETTWVQIPWAEISSFKLEGEEESFPPRDMERTAAYFKPQLKDMKPVSQAGRDKGREPKQFKKGKASDWEKGQG